MEPENNVLHFIWPFAKASETLQSSFKKFKGILDDRPLLEKKVHNPQENPGFYLLF